MTKTTDPQVRLKGNRYARPDYFHTDVTTGATRTPSGLRVCTLTSDFLLGFRDALVYECGKSFRNVMKACGKRWGKTFIAGFEKELATEYQTPAKDLPAGVVHACLADAFNYHGWGQLTVDLSLAEHGIILAEVADSVLPAVIRQSERPVDHLLCGLLASVFGHFAGAELDAVQTDCPTLGAGASRFLIASPERIVEIVQWIDANSVERPVSHDDVLRQLIRPVPNAGSHGESENIVSV